MGHETAEAWAACELEEHVEEVRTRHREVRTLLDERPFDMHVVDAVDLFTEAVRELLDHCDGLHDDDVLVRVMER